MKKILIVLFTVTIFFCFSVFMSFASILGDVDNDEQISASDARLALRASVGLETLTQEQFFSADTDFDGIISASDSRMILRASVGLETLSNATDGKNEGIISVSKKLLSIYKNETISVEVSYDENEYPDGISLNAEYDATVVDVEWGDWDGLTIPLTIIPIQNGTTVIKISVIENPNEYQDINIEVTGQNSHQRPEGNIGEISEIKLQQMAALGIDTAYKSAKFPSTLHLRAVTYENVVNGYGDLVTRMVLQCYAANSFGGYGDIYVVVLCCDYETSYCVYEWGGLYFDTSAYNNDPGLCENWLDNEFVMMAYRELINNPKDIPYD